MNPSGWCHAESFWILLMVTYVFIFVILYPLVLLDIGICDFVPRHFPLPRTHHELRKSPYQEMRVPMMKRKVVKRRSWGVVRGGLLGSFGLLETQWDGRFQIVRKKETTLNQTATVTWWNWDSFLIISFLFRLMLGKPYNSQQKL